MKDSTTSKIVSLLIGTSGGDVIGEARIGGGADADVVALWNAIVDLWKNSPEAVINADYLAYITSVSHDVIRAMTAPYANIPPEQRVHLARAIALEQSDAVARETLKAIFEKASRTALSQMAVDSISDVLEKMSHVNIQSGASFTKASTAFKSLEQAVLAPQLPLPFDTLHNALPNGLQQGEIMALIMPTGVGKTAFALHWVTKLAPTHYVLYITSETEPYNLVQRVLRYGYVENGVRYVAVDRTIREGILQTTPEATAFYQKSKQVYEKHLKDLSIHYETAMSPERVDSIITAAAINAKKAGKPLFIVADYIGLGFAAPDKSGTEWSQMAACGTTIKTCCARFNASALLIQQANADSAGYTHLTSPKPYGGIAISQKSQVILSAARKDETGNLSFLLNSNGNRVADSVNRPIILSTTGSPITEFYILKANSGVAGYKFETTFVGSLGLFLERGTEMKFADTLPEYTPNA